MKNLLLATQTAFFQALKPITLNADLQTIAGAPVTVHTFIPAETRPPFIKVGQLSSESEGEAGYSQVERITVEVVAVYRGEGNGPLLAMMHAARSALDGQRLTSPDAYIQPPYFLTSDVPDPINIDGITFVGVQSFECLVEPAE